VIPGGIRGQVTALEREVQRIRGGHQRVHDVLELVTEVLVPVSDPADPRLVEALEHLRRLLPDSPARP
jgi:hypothetical protein